MKTNCTLLMPVFLVMLFAGCDAGKSVSWQMGFEQEQGRPVLDCEKFKVRFDGVHLNSQPGRGGASVAIQISGGGTTIYNLAALDNTITTSYSAGVNTITFKQYELKVLDDGKRLQIGNSTIDLGAEKQTVVVHADGTVEKE